MPTQRECKQADVTQNMTQFAEGKVKVQKENSSSVTIESNKSSSVFVSRTDQGNILRLQSPLKDLKEKKECSTRPHKADSFEPVCFLLIGCCSASAPFNKKDRELERVTM
eukprot:scaffold140127_cov15-Tisochrysis_lutea.AAC.1